MTYSTLNEFYLRNANLKVGTDYPEDFALYAHTILDFTSAFPADKPQV